MPAAKVTIADGSVMNCNSQVPQLQWWVQGQTLQSIVRVLPLKCYDLILGVDWLETHSPMWVHWKRKKMKFTHNGQRITLRGVNDCTSKCSKLTTRKLKGMLRKGGVAQVV